jgi:dihydropteroate synthase
LIGIVNASPDSFSDRGGADGRAAVLERGRLLAASGADVVEVGGQTLRDTATISRAAEIERVVPVIADLAGELDVPIAVDTFSSGVAAAALEAGAAIVNDPTGFRDPEMADVVASASAGVVLTHFFGPAKSVPASYPDVDVPGAVVRWALQAIGEAERAGIPRARVAIDPGIGLGKSPFQDLDVLRRLDELVALGRPVFLPVSNKKVIGAITGAAPAARRPGTAAAVVWGYLRGARIFRVHDVAFMRDALLVAEALATGEARRWHLLPG